MECKLSGGDNVGETYGSEECFFTGQMSVIPSIPPKRACSLKSASVRMTLRDPVLLVPEHVITWGCSSAY